MQTKISCGSKILDDISNKSDDSEFYTPIPEGYQTGETKYVFVFGTVMSGLGKGIFSSSLGALLKDRGLNVAPIKMEGYLNIDSGTLNPFRHGEVFVLKDGMECDMDLGTYERMLDQELTKDNYTTSGQIFTSVLNKERDGKYLGRDVQVIPHVTGEIKNKLRNLAVKSKADVVLVEIGGTVGDFENGHYIEAARELAYEEGHENIVFVALTYVLEPKILGEQKSKAAQLGIKRLLEMGIQPQIIACRCSSPVTEKVMEKISIYTNVPMNRVFSMHDMKSIYMVPELLYENKIDQEIIDLLGLKYKTTTIDENRKKRLEYIEKLNNINNKINIGITGKYIGLRDSYASIIQALEHAGAHLKSDINIKWIDTTEVNENNVFQVLSEVDGIIVPGGFGSRGVEGKISCVKYARENNMPYLGICYGFQMAIIEYARNVCNLKSACSTEVDPNTSHPVIDILPEQKKIEGLGGNMRLGARNIEIKENSKVYSIYNKTNVIERFRHRFECNPEYISLLENNGLVFSGKAPNVPIMQFLELKDHPFFIGTQAHPCFQSRPNKPHPLFYGLVDSALKIKNAKTL